MEGRDRSYLDAAEVQDNVLMSKRGDPEKFFAGLQDEYCRAFQDMDGRGAFKEVLWKHGVEGGGRSRGIINGAVFEKGAINFSAITTELSGRMASKLRVDPGPVFATGISVVLHPDNPFAPTVHMNLRYIELAGGDAWFGGGIDLTPWYLFDEDAGEFHATLRKTCDAYDPSWYGRFTSAADEYFWLKHRNEARGVGGIFFDYLRGEFERHFDFVMSVGNAFVGAYSPIINRRKDATYSDRHKRWQCNRRGRYVEFNLLYDRGTLFGLETGGRTESILMSLPPVVHWADEQEPEPGSEEARLIAVLRKPRGWA